MSLTGPPPMPAASDTAVVVTGGAGFIGSHLCDRLVADGATVVCIDNFCTGRRETVLHLAGHPRFTLVDQVMVEPLALPQAVSRIYNLACAASPQHYQRDPVATMRTCVIGAYNVLELARRKGARVLQASTSEIYGDPEVHPQTEDYVGHVNPIGPRSCYDEGKRAAETIFFDYHRMYRLPIKVARIFNTYGPRMLENDGRVISNFIVQALRGEPITLYGDGSQTRSFCFVADMIEGLVRLMESEEAFCGPCNLGNPQELTIRQIAEHVLARTGSAVPLALRPLPQDDPRRRKPSIALAEERLGWRPTIDLDRGLALTIAHFAARERSTAARATA